MKIFKILFVALVAMIGLNSCSDDCDHEFIEVDYSKSLVGTWTCFQEGYAEALVINADGSVLSTGVEDGEYWENIKGNIKTINNKMTMTFEDDDNFEGRFEMLSGVAFTIYEEDGESFTYCYCENDLSDEIVGMWVCNDGLTDDVTIMSYSDNGKMTITAAAALGTNDPLVKRESNYVVVGNLLFTQLPAANVEGQPLYTASCITYTAKATSAGDIMTHKMYALLGNDWKESVISFLRIKQELNLTGKTYAYNSAYVTNAKGADEDFNITGSTFNMANIKAGDFDMMFRSVLFCMNLNANSITQRFLTNGVDTSFDTPITVEGNKVTLDMSAANPAFRNIEMYMFQDADDSQLHIYMPTQSFINYFANLEVVTLLTEGKIDPTDAAAVAKVYADMEARVESINVSFVMKAIEPVE